MLICEYCNKSFNRVGTGRIARFCCEHCRRKWRSENEDKLNITKYKKICPVCGEAFESISKTQKCCSKACNGKSKRTGRTTYEKVCLYCNNTFTTINKNNKYCSSTCGSRHYNVGKKRYKNCLYCGKQFWNDHFDRYDCCSKECSVNYRFGTKEERLIRNEQLYQQKLEASTVTKNCRWCGEEFSTSTGQIYCSSNCSAEFHKKRMRDEWAEKFVPIEFYCTECGVKVITDVGNPRSSFCSEKCCARYGKKTESAKARRKKNEKRYKKIRQKQLKEAFVAPVTFDDIYKRDGGICKVCGLPIKKAFDKNNYWGATIDHIIPLSKGGTHQPSNCQLAHRICNSIKNDATELVLIDWDEMASKENYWKQKLDLYKIYMNDYKNDNI